MQTRGSGGEHFWNTERPRGPDASLLGPGGVGRTELGQGGIKCKPRDLTPFLGSLEADTEAKYFNLCSLWHTVAICQIHCFFFQTITLYVEEW